jgi:uncharacterized protein YqhQ
MGFISNLLRTIATSGLSAPVEAEDRHVHASLYGGQAIIEGVMMKGPERTAAAVRNPAGEIVQKVLRESKDEKKKNVWYKTPVIRGIFVLIDSVSLGYSSLMFSAEVADPDAKPSNPILENLMLIGSLAIALVVFKFIPMLIATWILGSKPQDTHATGAELLNFSVAWAAVEGVIKAGILVAYVLSIRLMKDIRRVFQYHGAEHKTINAYEAGSDLTIADVMKYPTFHPRCGTSFLFAVILFSLLFAMMFPLLTWWLFGNPLLAMNLKYRLVMHIIFLPVIAAIGYEFIRMTAKLNPHGLFMRTLTYPGRLFQRITALEPDRSMVEVALAAMHQAMGLTPAPVLDRAIPTAPASENIPNPAPAQSD